MSTSLDRVRATFATPFLILLWLTAAIVAWRS